MAILGISVLYAIVTPKIGHSEHPRLTAAQADAYRLESALGAYEVDNGAFPKRLQDLVQKPNVATNWHGPYLERLPVDPWGNPYVYHYPGKHNLTAYDLLSVGPDGKEGTDDDLGNWMN